MKEFLDKDFLLDSETAKTLYHEVAEVMPIYDYHCHLSPKDIYEDRVYGSITELWLCDHGAGDHYKWRAMRANGVKEECISGSADDKAKFIAWATTVPDTIGNPLYHWTHLEMRRYFGINELLSAENAERLYDEMNAKLSSLSVRKIILMSNVKYICTTDDPLDDLRYHKLLADDKSFPVHVYPSFRPDKIVNINAPTFVDYVKRYEETVGYAICDAASLAKALEDRVAYFASVGCRVSDHSLEEVVYEDATEEEVTAILAKGKAGLTLTDSEVAKYKGYVNVVCGRLYCKYGFVEQYHLKAFRNNSKRMFAKIGPDTGFDSLDDRPFVKALSGIMNKLDETNELPKSILYSLNPNDLEALVALGYSFQEGGKAGKIQIGSAWWFNDQKEGMVRQMKALSALGLISKFIGMLTDSRSFLSFTRHEYFRRILCNYIGELVEHGEYPCDMPYLKKLIAGICYDNADAYFNEGK